MEMSLEVRILQPPSADAGIRGNRWMDAWPEMREGCRQDNTQEAAMQADAGHSGVSYRAVRAV